MQSQALRVHREASRQAPNSAVLDDLKTQIRTIERGRAAVAAEHVLSLGDETLDRALPWNGLPGYGLHEISGDAAAIGFAAGLMAGFGRIRANGTVLWCQRERALYPQGLTAFGFDPDRMILAHGANDTEILWALEEGLRTPGLIGVVGRINKIPPISARRLQLAAEESGVMCLLLRPGTPHAPASAALTRWRVTAMPGAPIDGPGFSPPSWSLELQRCRLGEAGNDNRSATSTTLGKPRAWPRNWEVEWCDETGGLALAAGLRDRPVEPRPLSDRIH